MQALLRLPSVTALTGLSRSTIYLRISQGLWTKPVPLGAKAVGWPDNEIASLNTARIAGMSDDEISQLVKNLEVARKRVALEAA